MFTRKKFVLTILSVVTISALAACRPPFDIINVSDRLFTYGMAMLVLSALILLFSGKFGFAVIRGFRLLFKGTPIRSYGYDNENDASADEEATAKKDSDNTEPVQTLNNTSRFMLLALVAGIVNVLLSIILIVITY